VPIVVVGAAQLPLMIRQNDGRASYISTSGSLPYRVAQLFKQDLIGEGQPVKGLLTAICAVAVVIGLGLLLARARRQERSAALAPLAIGLSGIALALVIASVGTDYFNTRNLLPTWPALMLVVALGLGVAGAGRLGAVGVAMLVIVGLFCVVNVDANPRYQRLDWRGAAHVLGPVSQPRGIVADIHGAVPLDPYLRGLGTFPTAGAPLVREVDVLWLKRNSAWGAITPITPAPLPGFALAPVIRTASYVVLRYLAPRPTPERYAALARLYPDPTRTLALLQRP
jgi:hypothetical protein